MKPKIVATEKHSEDQLSYRVLLVVFDQSLRLMHPFMPFITEEIWQRLPHKGLSIAVQPFPGGHPAWTDAEAEARIGMLQDVITKIRNLRAEINLDPGRRIPVRLASSDPGVRSFLLESRPYILNLARCDRVEVVAAVGREDHSARSVASGVDVEIPLEGLIDLQVEKGRIEREILKLEREMTPIRRRLQNQAFMSNAPEKVVELNRNRLIQFQEKLGKLREYRDQL